MSIQKQISDPVKKLIIENRDKELRMGREYQRVVKEISTLQEQSHGKIRPGEKLSGKPVAKATASKTG